MFNFPFNDIIIDNLINVLSDVLMQDQTAYLEIRKEITGFTLSSKDYGTELRVLMNPNVIKISRVAVEYPRKGTFTKIMAKVEDFARLHGIAWVTIECVTSKSMYNWCMKNNYKVNESTAFASELYEEKGYAPVLGDYRRKVCCDGIQNCKMCYLRE